MLTLIVVIAAVSAIMWRVIHLVAVLDLHAFDGHRLRLLGLALHVALAGTGAVACLAGVLGASAGIMKTGGLMLLVSLSLLALVDRRSP